MSRIGRGAALRRGWRARRAQRRSQSERGFTLMETLIACAVMVVVIASTVPVVRVFFDEQLAVNRTYSGADEVLLTSLGDDPLHPRSGRTCSPRTARVCPPHPLSPPRRAHSPSTPT